MNTIFAYSNQKKTQKNRPRFAGIHILQYLFFVINHKKIPMLIGLGMCLLSILAIYIYFITMTSTSGYFLTQASKKYDNEMFMYNVEKLHIIDMQSRIREDISRRTNDSQKTIIL